MSKRPQLLAFGVAVLLVMGWLAWEAGRQGGQGVGDEARGVSEMEAPPAPVILEPIAESSVQAPKPLEAASDVDAETDGVVVGRVWRRDDDGMPRPLPGASVELAPMVRGTWVVDRRAEPRVTESDPDGRFDIDGVEMGSYHLAVDDRESASEMLWVTLRENDERGERRDLGDILLEPGSDLLVDVVGPAGESIEGAVVRATPEGRRHGGLWPVPRDAEPLGNGRYRFQRFPHGEAYVRAFADGYNCLIDSYSLYLVAQIPSPEVIVLRQVPGPSLGGVIQDEAGAPLEGALVEIYAAGGCWPDPMRTTADGRFEFSSLTSESYAIRVHADGYLSQRFDVKQGRDDHVIVLSRGIEVRGVVVEAGTGRALAGARVMVGGDRIGHTGSEGTFSVTGLPSDLGVISVDHAEYLPLTVELPEGDSAAAYDLGTLRLARGQVRTLSVREAESGAPVAGAVIELSVSGNDTSAERTGTTLTDGTVEFGGLPVGAGKVSARARGYLPLEKVAFHVEEQAGEDGDGPAALELVRGGVLRGRVFGRRGDPVAGASVKVELSDSEQAKSDEASSEALSSVEEFTDLLGQFHLSGLPAASVIVVASSTSQRPGASEIVEIIHGEEVDGVDVRLPAGGQIEGTVFDERGQGLPGVTVSAFYDGDDRGDEATRYKLKLLRGRQKDPVKGLTDDKGRYTLKNLLAGGYRLYAEAPARIQPAPRRVKLEDGDALREIDIRFEAGEVLRGRVVSELGEPQSGWWVWFADVHADDCTDGEGRFEIRGVQPGRYQGWVARHRGYLTNREPEAQFECAVPGSELVLRLERKAVVTGRVRSAVGERPQCIVRLTPLGKGIGSAKEGEVDGDGRFEVRVFPGRYRVEAIPQSDSIIFLEEEQPLATRPLEIDLAAGELRSGLDLVFTNDGRFFGRIERWSGAAIGARVELQGAGGVFDTVTDEGGQFDFERLPPGQYDVLLRTRPSVVGAARRLKIEVPSAAATEIDFLVHSVYVRGQVRAASEVESVGATVGIVSLNDSDSAPFDIAVVTDAAGNFDVELPGGGLYRFDVTLADGTSASFEKRVASRSEDTMLLDAASPR